MQLKVNRKFIFTCMLLCSLFLTGCISVFDTNGIFFFGGNNPLSPVTAGSQPSAMTGGMHFGADNFLAAANSPAELFISALKPARLLGSKTSLHLFHAIIPAALLTGLIFYAGFSKRLSIQLFSSTITIFLHKKDGKK
jgi:hypothetical protein